ncbi:MAG TPA: class I fructose-bisphosphate aldolase [Pseudonocardia sp.]|nr:class I fructose-bisphosphate aldolase [Pseudonocardia sp.]
MTGYRQVAARMMAAGKGILAADESIGTMSARLAAAGIEPTEEHRRAYRELLTATPRLADGVSGVILNVETLRQRFADGTPFPRALRERGLLTGVKVDTGAVACPGLPGEKITQGLDGLPARLAEYAELGAVFAKWRAVLSIGPGLPAGTLASEVLPSEAGVRANAHALARYAAACQQAGLVPIVEPEVLMDGDHPLARCSEVTARVHAEVRTELETFGVDLAGVVLKPNMVLEGVGCAARSSAASVASATREVLAAWPGELAGVAFLSGGQSPERATANLAAICGESAPWPLTFSFGRALVDPALAAWSRSFGTSVGAAGVRACAAGVRDGQAALAERVHANAAAVRRPLVTELHSRQVLTS